jgi:2-keto-4-pentenoate hydratase
VTHELTKLLLAHRQAGTTIDTLPPELTPPDMATAYAIQSEVLAAIGPVGAWKVSPVPAEGQPFCSPLPASYVHGSGATLTRSGLHGLAVEVEVGLKLGRDLPAGSTVEDARAAIGSIHLALEIVASRYTDRTSVAREAAFADFQSSGAIVLGDPVAFDGLPDFAQQALSLTLDGQADASTQTGPSTGNLLSAITWLADHAASRGLPLTSGTVIITGARLGPVAFDGREAVAEGDGLGTVRAAFV